MNDKKQHLHIYERIRGKGGMTTKYRCIDPDCTHREFANLIEGKRARCSICKVNEIIINRDDLKRKHFRCVDCSNTAAARLLKAKQDYVGGMMAKLMEE